MFKLSTRSTYGLRACLALAQQLNGPPVTTVSLSDENNIPRRYLEQILNAIRQSGLVESTRGPKGGYRLSRPPGEITVADVVRAVEGDMPPILCSMPELRSANCRTHTGCASRKLCFELENSVMEVLGSTTLDDLRAEAQRLCGGRESEGLLPLKLIEER
ncbi:MAG: Rrf2 family transcriptional regulator [Vulcanimicrobiota bacterium]